MPMVPSRLQAALKSTAYAKLKELQEPKIPADASASQKADIDQTWQDLADAIAACAADIITEVKAATVTTTVTVASVTGVLAGPAASGPGTGSGTGTIA